MSWNGHGLWLAVSMQMICISGGNVPLLVSAVCSKFHKSKTFWFFLERSVSDSFYMVDVFLQQPCIVA